MGIFGDDTQYNRASTAADIAGGAYGLIGRRLGDQEQYLERVARGEDSVSAEQLRHALAQTVAQQRSMAAAARPQDSTIAAIHASRNAMQAAGGLAGQQAEAGMLERQRAQEALMRALLERRQQEQQTMLQSRQQAMATQPPSWMDRFGSAIQAGAQIAAMA